MTMRLTFTDGRPDFRFRPHDDRCSELKSRQFIKIARKVLEGDAKVRERAADEVTDHPGAYTPAQASALATLLAATAAAEEVEDSAMEAELHAIVELTATGHVRLDDLSPLREINLDDLPPQIREYVSDLLEE
ncbi:hypothetical protein ABZY42_25655 [Streptomyces sp. NPDC006622]|uniref:hypothetical protein n=1 Tax=Streptomyces sp. NPDC006622 TaxID=3155459 RepID=UPI0033A93112